MIGQFIAHYKITGKLGEGGMGAVYRASDTKLGREVAIKVLPDSFSNDADRLLRFTREAQVLASLNHPNIATIHGVEDCAIVMELVDGPTLADRLENGALPVEEILPIARQIAEALEAAHERNVIHRDLKPANIKITPEGTVKVLDFGLAKLVDGQDNTGPSQSAPTRVKGQSPTMAGTIMGTAEYMSPEQAAGKATDKRTDIWAFGVVLWEMLTGQHLFDGETVSHTLADVLRAPIDCNKLPPTTQGAIRNLVMRCLERDVKRRLRDIGEARIALEGADRQPDPAPATSSARSSRLAWGAAAVMGLIAGLISVVHFRESPSPARVIRLSIPAPDGVSFRYGAELSPDGRYVAYRSVTKGQFTLWVRPLDSSVPRAVSQEDGMTDTLTYPFWSPDSRWIGYASAGKLKKVDVTAASPSPLAICTCVGNFRGATWSRDGVILFAPSVSSGLLRVAASGGDPVPVTTVEVNTQLHHRFPHFLPDGRHFLFFIGSGQKARQGVYLGDLQQGGEPTRVLESDSHTVFVPRTPGSSSGHLLFSKDNTLRAVPFDTARLAVSGEPVVVAKGVDQLNSRGAFSASAQGMLAYWTGEAYAPIGLKWYGRDGRVLESLPQADELPKGVLTGMSLSRDNRRLAVGVGRTAGGFNRIYLVGLDQRSARPIGSDQRQAVGPVWSPDAKHLAFGYSDGGAIHPTVQDPDQASAPQALLKTPATAWPREWSSNGEILVYHVQRESRTETWAMSLPDKKTERWPDTHQLQIAPASANPWWVAYISNETGRQEVYLESFTRDGKRDGRTQISTRGGTDPRWRADGRELYFLAGGKLMAASVRPDFTAADPIPLLEAPPLPNPSIFGSHRFAPSTDGKRFLFATVPEARETEPLSVVVNWQEGLVR
jgi:eukaryotic-like serine/threonine-protein kinase